MTCDDTTLLLNAYLDDELDAAQSAAVVRHMHECNACAARYSGYVTLHKALAQPALYRRAPDALRQRWSTPPAATIAPAPRARRWSLGLAAAAGFAGALLLVSPLAFREARQADAREGAIVADVISGHVRSLQQQHLMDVASTDQHTVKPWFAGKLDFSPRVKDLTSEGFPLVGGRLDAIDGHAVAALVYRRRLHVINLYQWPAEAAPATQQETQRHGYTVIRWAGDGMQFAAISDVSETDLKQFVLAFRNEADTSPNR